MDVPQPSKQPLNWLAQTKSEESGALIKLNHPMIYHMVHIYLIKACISFGKSKLGSFYVFASKDVQFCCYPTKDDIQLHVQSNFSHFFFICYFVKSISKSTTKLFLQKMTLEFDSLKMRSKNKSNSTIVIFMGHNFFFFFFGWMLSLNF